MACSCPAAACQRRPKTGSGLDSVTDRRLASSTRLAAEHLYRGPGDLLGRDVVEVLRNPPAMPERVDDLPVAVAPEHILQRLMHRGPGRHSAFPQGVGVLR